MIAALVILATLVFLVFISNVPQLKPKMQYWNVISFNPLSKPPDCPMECKMRSLDDLDGTPSILLDSISNQRCTYKKNTIVYPCSSKCCA